MNSLARGEDLLIKRAWVSGKSLQKIAEQMGRSKETVLRHVSSMMRQSKSEVLAQDKTRSA